MKREKNTKPSGKELDYYINEAGEIVLAKPDDDEDEQSEKGTLSDWQFFRDNEETELVGEPPERKRNHAEKDAEALEVWRLYHQLGSYKKVAYALGLKESQESTVKMKYQRAFQLITGKPFSQQNHAIYKKSIKQQRQAEQVIPCLTYAKKLNCKEPCEELEKLLPELVKSEGKTVDPEDAIRRADKFQKPKFGRQKPIRCDDDDS